MTAELICAAAALIGMGCPGPPQVAYPTEAYCSPADPLKAVLKSIVRDTKRRNCWPQPFVRPDRYTVRAPFAVMVANGWRRQNMLSDHHFSPQTHELTEAGQLRVRWILTQAPPAYRAVYVHVAEDAEKTAKRLESVQQLAAQLVPHGELPQVLQTDIPDHGWPAERVEAINRALQGSTNTPRIPYRKALMNMGQTD